MTAAGQLCSPFSVVLSLRTDWRQTLSVFTRSLVAATRLSDEMLLELRALWCSGANFILPPITASHSCDVRTAYLYRHECWSNRAPTLHKPIRLWLWDYLHSNRNSFPGLFMDHDWSAYSAALECIFIAFPGVATAGKLPGDYL